MLAEVADSRMWGDVPLTWFLLGIAGQAMFFGRFLVQWIVSERARKVTVPLPFWYMSILGSLFMVAYGFLREDLVIIIGQTTGTFVYARNLYLRSLEANASG